MLNRKMVISALLLVGSISSTPVFSNGFEIIAPHRAVYEIKLMKATERSGIKAMNGRMVYEVRGNECDGISLRYRFLTRVTTARDQFLSDQHTSTFESADGRNFNFLIKSFLNEQLEETVKGRARRTDDGVYVTLDSPSPQEFEFSKASFLTSYMIKMIEQAKNGEHFLRGDLYDGSDGGDETIATFSVISNAKTILDSKDGQNAEITAKLKGLRAWSVSMSYFDKNTVAPGEQLPVFESSFLLFENGISSDLVMRYPDYTLSGKMTELELFDTYACQQDG